MLIFQFNATDPDAAGGGGEYTVQIGFGWTNGVGASLSLSLAGPISEVEKSRTVEAREGRAAARQAGRHTLEVVATRKQERVDRFTLDGPPTDLVSH